MNPRGTSGCSQTPFRITESLTPKRTSLGSPFFRSLLEKKAQGAYRKLLMFLCELGREHRIWFAVPGEIDRWWRARHQMRVVGREGDWRIEGEGAERAKLAFAQRVDERLEYEIAL